MVLLKESPNKIRNINSCLNNKRLIHLICYDDLNSEHFNKFINKWLVILITLLSIIVFNKILFVFHLFLLYL